MKYEMSMSESALLMILGKIRNFREKKKHPMIALCKVTFHNDINALWHNEWLYITFTVFAFENMITRIEFTVLVCYKQTLKFYDELFSS